MIQIFSPAYWLGFYAVLIFIPIILFVCCMKCIRGRRRGEVVSLLRGGRRREAVERAPQRIVEKERIVERVLVICPYCGHKNEQGISKCGECGADL
ncbi:MAG: zinc-ribbon domain-containing protein [Candidatus Thorarchaeota archaeon]